MTSTEFTAGIGEGARISSKVLKPPGGGSSDIFGLGNSYAAGKSTSENGIDNSTTHSRLFGQSTNTQVPVKQPEVKSVNQIETNHTVPARPKKVYIRRNPITGEEIEINLDAENEEKNGCDKNDNTGDNKEEEAKPVPSEPVPNKTVTTSIRVRAPPGGKSSGIF